MTVSYLITLGSLHYNILNFPPLGLLTLHWMFNNLVKTQTKAPCTREKFENAGLRLGVDWKQF